MKKTFLLIFTLLLCVTTYAQKDELKAAEKKLAALKEMRGSYDLANADERKAKNE